MIKHWKSLLLPVILTSAMFLSACGGMAATTPSPSAPTSTTPVTSPPLSVTPSSPATTPPDHTSGQSRVLNDIQDDIHQAMKTYMMAQEETFGAEQFENGQIPTYFITHMRQGDADFDLWLQAQGFDPSVVEEYLLIEAVMSVNANTILVFHTNDIEKTKIDLEAYHAGQINIWQEYLPDQYEKVKRNVIGTQDAYVYYVTHDIEDQLVEVIQHTLNSAA